MAIDKYESRRIRNEIRRVLLQCWDPIGISEEPKAQDEYDGYLGGVYGLLTRGASDKEIADHLVTIVEQRMSLHPESEATENTVRALRAIQILQR